MSVVEGTWNYFSMKELEEEAILRFKLKRMSKKKCLGESKGCFRVLESVTL